MHSNFWQNLSKPVIGLSPMDGVTDAAFRYMVAKYGKPSVIFTEFINVEGLAHGAVKTLPAFLYDSSEHPIIGQIYGITPENFYQAAFIVAELGFDGIDINMGCPSKAVSGHGGGAGLIKTPKLACDILRTAKLAAADWAAGKTLQEAGVHQDLLPFIRKQQKVHGGPPPRRLLPVSVKTRLGYEKVITESWIETLLSCEPDNITLHGRTLKQMYSGEADWNEIAKAAAIVHAAKHPTTILGNGDVKSLPDALEKIKRYGVDGALIGRAVFGEPWIFNDAAPPDLNEKFRIALEHCLKHEEIFRVNRAADSTLTPGQIFAPMKKHLGWYCRGFAGAKELRMQLMACDSSSQVEEVLKHHQLPG